MSNQDKSREVVTSSNYTSKSETERTFSVFDGFKKNAEDIKSSTSNDNTSDHQPLLTMSSMGQLGRFGNQLFQYAFLRICAENSEANVECPAWIGQTLFGHNDAPISRRLPPAVEQQDIGQNLFDVIPEFIPYLEKLADTKSCRVRADALEKGLVNVDLWGFFQVHTHLFRPYQQYFRSLFQPVSDLKIALENSLNILRSKGKTIIGIHIRRGDYVTEPRVGFTLVFPTKWYCGWLDDIWSELEDPVLFLCSDDLESVIHDFAQYSPITSKDLEVRFPERMQDLDIEFYADFFILSSCDVVVTSNSNFSFVACMLNERAKKFVRPHWDFSSKFLVFDPWDSEPLLWLGGKQSKFLKSLPDVLYTTFITQGFWEMIRCLLIYVPRSRVKGWTIRGYLGYQIQGTLGVVKSLLYTLGWRSIWKQTDSRTLR